MMKRIFFSLILTLSLFWGFNNVEAEVYDEGSYGKTILVCDYTGTDDPYVHWQIRYSLSSADNPEDDEDSWMLEYFGYGQANVKSYGKKHFVEMKGDWEYIRKGGDGISYSVGELKTFTCPAYFNINKDYNHPCLTDQEKCNYKNYKNNFDDKVYVYKLTEDASKVSTFSAWDGEHRAVSIFNELYEQASKGVTCTDVGNNKDINKLLYNNLTAYFKSNYSGYEVPSFVDNYISNGTEITRFVNDFTTDCSNTFEEEKAQREEQRKTDEEKLANQLAAGEITQEQYDTEQSVIDEEREEDEAQSAIFAGQVAKTSILVNNVTIREGDDCTAVLGSRMSAVVRNIFKTIQYAGPILVFVLSALDFLKAVISGNQDDMKKASQRLGKRIVFAILLFFVPMLCNLLLEMTGVIESAGNLCVLD